MISAHLSPIHPVWSQTFGPDPVHEVSLQPLGHDLPLPAAPAPPRPHTLLVADVMSSPVIVARTHQSAGEALESLQGHAITGMPVLNGDGGLAGVISHSDLLAHLAAGGDLSVEVSELMSPSICWATPDATLADAARLMLRYGIHRLVVLSSDELVGMVTSLDLLRGGSFQ